MADPPMADAVAKFLHYPKMVIIYTAPLYAKILTVAPEHTSKQSPPNTLFP